MSEERTVILVCTNQGHHGRRVLAELLERDGEVVDVRRRNQGTETVRHYYMQKDQPGVPLADFDRRCPSCGRNPRSTAVRLRDQVVRPYLAATEGLRVELDVSLTRGAMLF